MLIILAMCYLKTIQLYMHFRNNSANESGAIHTIDGNDVSFKDNLITKFSNNNRAKKGGAIYLYEGNNVSFKATQFIYNSANEGGAIYAYDGNNVSSFKDNSIAQLSNNNTNIYRCKNISYEGAICAWQAIC